MLWLNDSFNFIIFLMLVASLVIDAYGRTHPVPHTSYRWKAFGRMLGVYAALLYAVMNWFPLVSHYFIGK